MTMGAGIVEVAQPQTLSASGLHVSLAGNDANPGTADKPLATLAGARDALRRLQRPPTVSARVIVHEGTHYLDEPLVLSPWIPGLPSRRPRVNGLR